MQEENKSYFKINIHPMRIRQAATLNLNGCWWVYFIGILLYYIFSDIIINIVSEVFPMGYINLASNQIPESMQAYMSQSFQIPVVVSLYVLLMTGALELGRTIYTMTVLRDRMVIPNVLFEGFSVYFKALAISIIKDFLVAIGFMCFFVPGIVLYYSYRQVYYILAENGRIGVLDCLRESRRLMSGNKMALFRLDLTYIFPIIVSYLPSYLLLGYGMVDTSKVTGLLIYYVVQIPYFMVMSNYFMGQTVFYELLKFGSFKKFCFKGEDFFRAIDKE